MEPYFIKERLRRWYVVGKAEGDDCIEVFAFDRISDLSLSDEHFEFPSDIDPATYFDEVVGILLDDEYDCERVVVRFYNRQAKYINLLPIHKSQKIIAAGKDYIDFEYNLRPEWEFIHEILRYGREAEVLYPQWVREELRWQAEETVKRYDYSDRESPVYLFLDFDGVLNSRNYRNRLITEDMKPNDKFGPLFDPSAVSALAYLIEKYPEMKIVVTSSWRYNKSFDDLRQMWRVRRMPGKLHALLPRDSFCETRGEEVAEYLREHGKPASYLIIDDENDFTTDQQSHCIITDPAKGLSLSDLTIVDIYNI